MVELLKDDIATYRVLDESLYESILYYSFRQTIEDANISLVTLAENDTIARQDKLVKYLECKT